MNRHDSGRFCTESLESAAKRYKTLGFSIIPLNGARNPQHPKLPVIKWARFQHTLASDEELQSWFADQPNGGIGIVCGRISRLMVLDFDDPMVASEFRHLHPDLTHTFTVCSGTRKLPHFYYRLPEGMLVPTTGYVGVDLRGEGSYVVAPPTCVGESIWFPEVDLPIHEISDFDLRRVMRFLAKQKDRVVEQTPEAEAVVIAGQVSEFRHLQPTEDLIGYYRRHCCGGRNYALFQTALLARDIGVIEADFVLQLAPIHASEPGREYEAYSARYSEALRTIASAYSRPSRQKSPSSRKCLGNAIREWFLCNGRSNVARVLDGLYAVGMQPSQLFTELEACQTLTALKIGRRSIMAALKAIVGDSAVFELTNPPRHPPVYANAAIGSDDLNNSCEMSRGAKRVKNGRRGRPARLYQLPSPEEVAAKIGVIAKVGDALSNNDFGSSKAYRQALHGHLLMRRPGHYVRGWLATRLGVSRWTTKRYEKALGISVQPAYMEQSLSWGKAAALPEKLSERPNGVFIETSDGKRYPPVRGVALKLLKTGCTPRLKHQQGNYYSSGVSSVGIPTPPTVSRLRTGTQTAAYERFAQSQPLAIQSPQIESRVHSKVSSSVGIPTPPRIEPIFWLCPDCLDFHIAAQQPAQCSRCGSVGIWEIVSPIIWQDAQALKHWWQKRYREHQQIKRQHVLPAAPQPQFRLTDAAKALVDKLHAQIPGLSLTNARKLVSQFSAQLIEKALSVVRNRGGLRSPAGFLVAFLRSEDKLLNNSKNISIDRAKTKGVSAMDWLRKLANSEYLSFITNVDDILNLNLELPNTVLQG